MSDPAAAFIGNYANIVTRKTRSVCVVEVELPIEQMQAFIAAFGAPLPGKEVPVALARLDPSKPASEPRKGNGETGKERTPFRELSPVNQAAIRCSDRDFQRFCVEQLAALPSDVETPEKTAFMLRRFLNVDSRKQIIIGTRAGDAWQKLDQAFLDWKHQIPLPAGAPQ